MKVDMYVNVKVINETEDHCQFLVKGKIDDFTMTLSYPKDSPDCKAMLEMANTDKLIKLEGILPI